MRTKLALAALLALAGCNTNRTVGQNVDHDTSATGSAVNRAANATGNAVSNAASSTGHALDNAGTATRDALDPPRGPAERAGRATDRAAQPY